MSLMTEQDVLLQLGIVNADAVPTLAQISEIEEGAVGHGQVVHCRLVFCSLAGVLLTSRLPQNAHCCLLPHDEHLHLPICPD